MENQTKWNLDDLYLGINDPEIEKDLQKIKDDVLFFEKTYRGKINDETSNIDILSAIEKYEDIRQKSAKIITFASLLYTVNSDKSEYGNFWQKQLSANTAINNGLIFFNLDVIKLSDTKLKDLMADKILANYVHFLENIALWKTHCLSEKEEQIINDKMTTGAMAFSRLFDQQHSNRIFEFPAENGTEKMGASQVLTKLYDPERKEREVAGKVLTKGLEDGISISAYAYNMVVQDKLVNDKYYNFENPEDARHLENQTNKIAVDVMVSAISENYSIVKKFYQCKQEILGLEKLYDYDRYAPIEKETGKKSFNEGKEIVLEAFGNFSPEFKKLAEEFFDKNWIDAFSRKGKQGVAYCNYVTPDLHPYVMMNYQGDISDVSTLAHELGHGINARLAGKQTFLNFDWPLTLAETASVFGEMLVFEQLKKQVKNSTEKTALYSGVIERIFSSVFRQNAMFLFERDVFDHAKKNGELSVNDFNELWRKRQEEMFLGSVELTSNYDIWWSYIPHFIHTPFYVYAYSFGELLSLALFAKYKEEGDDFVRKYVEILEAGGSKSPDELLSPMGINLSDRAFWEKGIALIDEMVEEFVATSKG